MFEPYEELLVLLTNNVIDDFSNECPFKIASLMTIIFIMNILHCTEETIDLHNRKHEYNIDFVKGEMELKLFFKLP